MISILILYGFFLKQNFDLGRAYYKEVYFKKSKKIYG
jgi:hypothetical protein